MSALNKIRAFRVINLPRFFSNVNVPPQQEVVLEYLKNNDEGITVVGLNRSKQYNAFSKQLLNSLSETVERLKYDSSIRTIILRSLVPGIFSAGADLKERRQFSEQDVSIFTEKFRALNASIENLPVPVIAAIDGIALGGGLEISLACDIRVAATNAKMGLVETKLSIIPGSGGTQRLPRLINPSIAKELIYTARIFDGKQAKEYGITNYTEEQNENKDAAYQKALEIARDILLNGPLGVKMAKKAIDKGLQVDIATGNAIEEACYAQLIPTDDRLEALAAFAEKRKPTFTGK